MVQNLDLDLSTSVALTNQNTDLNSKASWTPQNSTQTTTGTVWAEGGSDGVRSIDPGNIYFPNGIGTGTADSIRNLQGSTSGQPWEFIGNYYNWPAATAGSGTAATIAPAVAADSICPKGWKLPDNEGAKSFINLIYTTYGLQDGDVVSSDKILAAPLNFVRAGYYSGWSGKISWKGAYGYWWSSTAGSSALKAYSVSTTNGWVRTQAPDDKSYGFTLRCVAR